MKKSQIAGAFLVSLAALGNATMCRAEDFPYERIHGSGNVQNRVNIMIVGDGWTKEQLVANSYKRAVAAVKDFMINEPPWRRYKHLLTFWRVDVPSPQSGSSHVFGNVNRDTYYSTQYPATYNTTGTATGDSRGLWFRDFEASRRRMDDTNPTIPRQVVVVVVNDPQHGGAATFTGTASSGYCTVSMAPGATSTFIHEIGHALVGLADEYAYAADGDQPAPRAEPPEQNVTIQTDPARVKWKSWFPARARIASHACNGGGACGNPGLGLHEGAKYSNRGVYRPKDSCLMRALHQPLCEVCVQASIVRLYQNVSLAEVSSPYDKSLTLQADPANTGANQNFLIWSNAAPDADLQVDWFLDGRRIAGATTRSADGGPSYALRLARAQLPPGPHTVRAVMKDRTPLVRDWDATRAPIRDPRMPNNVEWQVYVRAQGFLPRLRQMVGW